MNLHDTISGFRQHLQAENRSIKTIESYQRQLNRLLKFLGAESNPAEITSNQLDQFINSDLSQLRSDGRPRKSGSIANTKAALNSFFKWLQSSGRITQNPVITIRTVKHRSIPVFLTNTESKSLLKTMKETRGWQAQRDFVATNIILHTGVRLSELTGIDVDDVDFNGSKLRLQRTKGGQPAVKHINAKLRIILQPFIDQRKALETDCTALFLSQWNRRISDRQFALRLEKWAVKADIIKKVTPHVLRHTFATNLYARTKNLLAVQKALGHEYITTTQIYTHLQDEELQQALETL